MHNAPANPVQPARFFAGGEKVAIVHDWLNSYVGGERVLEQMLAQVPEAELFVAFDNMEGQDRGFLHGRTPHTSFMQNWRFVRQRYTKFLPLLTLAIEQLDVTGYDVVLSSSASIGKGVLTSADQMHVAYVHSPMRYAWDMQHQYLNDSGLTRGIRGFAARAILHHARLWDLRTANGVDHFIANSQYIARRIWRVYRREAEVIYPPVDLQQFAAREDKDSFYLAASRLVPYKRMHDIVQAFTALPDRKLVVIGSGPEMVRLKAAAGPNVEILGFQPTATLRDYMQRARAFVFAAEEDFGITPVEAQACGTPVIAYGRGGATETICGLDSEQPTGVFFDQQNPAHIVEAVRAFERDEHRISPAACRASAERFSVENFNHHYAQKVRALWERFEWKRSR
jgi:glycosyltransferase involved in cell wall biosynthesis